MTDKILLWEVVCRELSVGGLNKQRTPQPTNRGANLGRAEYRQDPHMSLTTVELLQLNAVAPINLLPAELFLDILLQVVNLDYDPYIHQLRSIAFVCRYWLHSVLAEPQFWQVINIGDVGSANLVFRRNPHGPLRIRCSGASDFKNISHFMELVLAQSHRWKNFQWPTVANFEQRWLPLFNASFDSLEVLQFHLPRKSTTVPIAPMKLAQCLKHVDVAAIALPWDEPNLSGLTSLVITQLDYNSPKLKQLVRVLQSSPQLEWLALEDLGMGEEHSNTLLDSSEVIQLPRLKGLALDSWVPHNISHSLASCIEAEECYRLEAVVPFSVIQRSGGRFNRLVQGALLSAEEVDITFRETEISVQISRGSEEDLRYPSWPNFDEADPYICVIVDLPYSLDDCEQFYTDFVKPIEDCHQSLIFEESQTGDTHFDDSYLTPWRAASSVTVLRGYLAINSLLECLSTSRTAGDEDEWLCPRLAELAIIESTAEVVDILERLVKNRLEASKGNTAHLEELELPLPIASVIAPIAVIRRLERRGLGELVQLQAHNSLSRFTIEEDT